MINIILLLSILGLLIISIILIIARKPSKDEQLNLKLSGLESIISKLDADIKDEFQRIRIEMQNSSKQSREELRDGLLVSFKMLSDPVILSLKNNEEKMSKLTETIDNKISNLTDNQSIALKDNRTELANSLKSFEDKFSSNVQSFNDIQKQKFDELIYKQNELKTETENRLEKIKETVENRLKLLQDENTNKLEEMRKTVDEKLHDALEKRLSDSFNKVSERLEQVHKGLGEMQSLANGVGDLKKVLANVKTRGTFGEVQLENILEEILSKTQYEKQFNIAKGNSNEKVDFAIKMPGRGDRDDFVYLPIDSKFPLEDYYQLINAYESADKVLVENSLKKLNISMKKHAKDIKEKYIIPPLTTDFGLLFLPTEGLYAEVAKQTDLIETLQRDFKIIITGPTTLAALLNSLQMGFRTLAIERQSGEVQKVLSAVKFEFNKFGDILEKAQKNLDQARNNIGELITTRTKPIQKALKSFQELPEKEANDLLQTGSANNDNIDDN